MVVREVVGGRSWREVIRVLVGLGEVGFREVEGVGRGWSEEFFYVGI